MPQGRPVPKLLDASPRFLFWEIEEVLIVTSFTVLGGIVDHPLLGGTIGVVLAALWSRLSARRARGFAIHLSYRYLGGFKLERTPPSELRHFLG